MSDRNPRVQADWTDTHTCLGRAGRGRSDRARAEYYLLLASFDSRVMVSVLS